MTRLVFELAYFFIGRVQIVWAQMLFNYILRIARDEWIEVKIKKHQDYSNSLRDALEAERFRRAITQPEHKLNE